MTTATSECRSLVGDDPARRATRGVPSSSPTAKGTKIARRTTVSTAECCTSQ